MKKVIDDPKEVVQQSLVGFQAAHSELVQVHFAPDWVGRKHPKEQGKVAVISGGGSGHEPLHIGYVGRGMLDAAVPGPVFTSPAPDPILAATKAADRGAGVLYLVKNYTGDVLNFDFAAELATLEGIDVRTVIIDDDCALDTENLVGVGRGVAGTVIVEKIVGAAAEAGMGLEELTTLAQQVVSNTRSMGVALGACTVPHVGQPSFELGEDEVEFGIGIHGEPGYRRAQMAPAKELVEELYKKVSGALGLQTGERVIALVNGLGGTPLAELYIANSHLYQLLTNQGVSVAHTLVGNYVTSIEMAGFSLTLSRLDPQSEKLFAAPVDTVAWRS